MSTAHAETFHDWRDGGLCGSTDPEAFFRSDTGRPTQMPAARSATAAAKAVCKRCQVRTACLNAALARDERTGIWGGMTPAERKKLTKPKESAK